MKNRKFWSRFLAGALSLTVVSSAMAPSLVDATAGDPPPEIWDDERVFPDPDSFSYDDVEVNFAKALQYVLYFYDAEMCGKDVNPKTGEKLRQLEWRGPCHVEDYAIPLQPVDMEGADAKFGTNLSQEFIDEYRDILDPDGDGTIDCGGGMHDAGDHVKFGLPGSYAASTVGWGYYEFRDAYKKSGQQEHVGIVLRHQSWVGQFLCGKDSCELLPRCTRHKQTECQLQKENEWYSIAKLLVECLVVEHVHGKQGTDATAKNSQQKKCLFADAPATSTRLPLVKTVDEKREHIDSDEIENECLCHGVGTEFLASIVMRHFVGQHDGNLHQAAHLAILAPRSLIDEFALPMLADGVAVRVVILNHIADDGL